MDKKKIILIGLIIIVLFIIGIIGWYFISISSVSNSQEEIKVNIEMGSSVDDIAEVLKENELIKNEIAFKIYVRLNKVSDFQAGKYYLKQNMDLEDITKMLQTGIMHDPNQINITYLEGKNFRWLAKEISKSTNNTEEDVMKILEDEEYIDSLIEKYWFLSDEIKNENIYYSLEGYLFPDTYSISNKDAKVEEIIEKMLDRMEEILEEYKEDIENCIFSVHEILTIASIVEMESMTEEGRKDVSSVVYNRLEKNMP